MARSNAGRSTTGERKVPEHYSTTPDRETAMHLRLTATRYLTGRASRAEVDEAYRWFTETGPGAGPTPPFAEPVFAEPASRKGCTCTSGCKSPTCDKL